MQMENAKYRYQIWEDPNPGEDYTGYVQEGSGKAKTLERFAEIVLKAYVGDEEYGWTVWDIETKHYLEYKGSKLVDQG
jgi:hypothetical protein